MNLKKLKEKRNLLMDELTTMVTDLENGEVRSLTDEERDAFDAKKKEIENIDATIDRVEEMRSKSVEADEVVPSSKEERSKEEAESRALDAFFRGHDLGVEERMVLASTSTNQALMPLEISKTIMQKLEEQCPIMEKARRFSSKGTIRLIREDSYGQAGITGENVNFKDTDVVFGNIELRAYKVTAMVQSTFELLQNVEIDLTQYLLSVIVRRLSKELNRLFLVGSGTNEPTGILKSGIEYQMTGIEIATFITMQTKIHPDYLNGCTWLVSRDTFTEMANMLDGTGRPYLVSNYDQVNNKIAYTFLGLPITVDYNMPEETPVALVNIGEAYAINVLTDITVRHLTETGFTQGYEVFAGYVMVDGKTVNEDALVLGKKASVAKAKK